MQTAYFFGSSTANGFQTKFWEAQSGIYGYHLIGGPGTGKSTLMKSVAAAFPNETVSVYHCASDPDSLDAVVLEERGIYLADATAPHEHSVKLPFVTGQTVDLAALLAPQSIRENRAEISRLQEENQEKHQQARYGITGICAMQSALHRIGKEAFRAEKASAFAKRFAAKMFRSSAEEIDQAFTQYRQLSAITPHGVVTYLPSDTNLILLQDECGYAAAHLMRYLVEEATDRGISAEVTRNYFQAAEACLQVYFPSLHLLFSTAMALDMEKVNPVNTIRMSRFYDDSQLKAQRNYIRFCRKTTESILRRTTEQLRDALTIHDALEQYYRKGLQYQKLNDLTEMLIAEIQNGQK